MSKYFPTIKWSSTPPQLGPTDEPLDSLPQHEEDALEQVRQATSVTITQQADNLPECDPWRSLNDDKYKQLKDEIHLRFLRFNNLQIEKAQNQMEEAMKWRAKSLVASLSEDVLFGEQVGLPIAKLAGPNEFGEILHISFGEAYIRREIDYAKQETGVGKLFDFLLYDSNGPQAKSGSIIMDFTNLGLSNIDIFAVKAGIAIYLKYFPDIFQRIIFVNYPRLVYGVWKAVHPLLDARTKSRIIWVESPQQLQSMISENFDEEEIPEWLGGKKKLDQLVLFNGKAFEASDLVFNFTESFSISFLVGEPPPSSSITSSSPQIMSKSVISLGDSSLKTADLSLLVPPHWLNDNLISFWFEHLRINVLRESSNVAFILPNVAYFIGLTNDEEDLLPIALAHGLRQAQLVLIPVNNATEIDMESTVSPAGSHWSLLVFHRSENAIFYIDSVNSNHVPHDLVHRLLVMFDALRAKTISLKAPLQNNSYDCGAFVCRFAEMAVQRFLKNQLISSMFGRRLLISQEEIDCYRQEIGKVACRLFDEGSKK